MRGGTKFFANSTAWDIVESINLRCVWGESWMDTDPRRVEDDSAYKLNVLLDLGDVPNIPRWFGIVEDIIYLKKKKREKETTKF